MGENGDNGLNTHYAAFCTEHASLKNRSLIYPRLEKVLLSFTTLNYFTGSAESNQALGLYHFKQQVGDLMTEYFPVKNERPEHTTQSIREKMDRTVLSDV